MRRITETGKYECRGCRREFVKYKKLENHTPLCKPNRDAYLKILALNLDEMDTKAQETLRISYELVITPEPLNENETKVLAELRRQVKNWGDTPMTPAFVRNLGNWSDEDIVQALSSKRKRTSAEDDLATSNLVPLPHPNASTTSHRTYRAPSPPPLEDLLANSIFADTVSDTHPPALDITHPWLQAQRQETSTEIVSQSINQQSSESEASVHLGDFRSSFDLAFTRWLDEENVSKAAIGRLLKDSAMQPITSKLSWKSVTKMKERLESVDLREVVDE